MLRVPQNRSGILLTDACGICLANLLLLRRARFLLNVCCLLRVYYDGEVYRGGGRTVPASVTVWGFINVCIRPLPSEWEWMFLMPCLALLHWVLYLRGPNSLLLTRLCEGFCG